MSSIEVKASDVKAIMAAVGSRKRTARVIPATEVTYSGTFWNGGSRSVEHGTFCGKPSQPHIYVNPSDMPRLLAAGQGGN